MPQCPKLKSPPPPRSNYLVASPPLLVSQVIYPTKRPLAVMMLKYTIQLKKLFETYITLILSVMTIELVLFIDGAHYGQEQVQVS
jgi:hypothetical protein